MEIQVTFRPKKSGIRIRVLPGGEVHVSAPLTATRRQVQQFVEQNREWIEQAVAKMKECGNKRQDFYGRLPLDTAQQRNEAHQRLAEKVMPMLEKYSAMVGVKISSVTFNNARTRWGSCNHRLRKINLSLYLLLLPDRCIEHVVAHECAHLLIPNHSADFYHVMDRLYPSWREARAETRRILAS